jgi:hypothetical protein
MKHRAAFRGKQWKQGVVRPGGDQMNGTQAWKYLGAALAVNLAMGACMGGRELPSAQAQPEPGAGGADGNATTCSACSVTGPLTVNGAVRVEGPATVVTADSDPKQWLGATLSLPADEPQSLEPGPYYITDLVLPYQGGQATLTLNCEDPDAGLTIVLRYEGGTTSGTRYFVPEGATPCVTGTAIDAQISWSGFRPYPASP